jgi:ATP-dependent DNA helicase DinG
MPLHPDPTSTAPHDVAALLRPEGPVAKALGTEGGGYERRPQQLAMGSAVAAALSSGRHLLVEAGTGVGKSFAYLVPALAWAVRHDKVVAVATSTIALQEQLVRRDLPLLARALPFAFTSALVKGRGNYLCLRRLDLALELAPALVDDGLRAQLLDIQAWSRTTSDGSRQDLPFAPREGVWDLVRAEHGNCLGRACRHYEKCSYQASRQRAHDAHLLVLNHHVLLADLALRRSGASFLPEVDAVIVDEAHDLEETAVEHLGVRASSLGLAQVLGRLWNPRTRQGLLAGHPDPALRVAVEEARGAAQGFYEGLSTAVRAGGSGGEGAPSWGFPDPSPVPPSLVERLETLATMVAERREAATGRDVAFEIGARARAVGEAAAALRALAGERTAGEVRWVDVGTRGITLCSAPVDAGPLLDEVLWKRVGTAVLTSATLTTGRPPSFAYLRRRLGLADADELALDSPFDYARQARIVLRADLPDPGADAARWEAALPDAVAEAVGETGGGTLVLFTATSVLQRVAAALRPRLEASGFEVLVQGEGLDRAALLDRFRRGGGVLFGVASFWQGVDVPGEALTHVVIVRLPFEVPTHPLQVARQERIERSGGDAFQELTLPRTALRLKQGFGRLIRRATDRGQVTVLDPRIVTRRYGRVLLDTLPECPTDVRYAPDPAPPD